MHAESSWFGTPELLMYAFHKGTVYDVTDWARCNGYFRGEVFRLLCRNAGRHINVLTGQR